MALAKHALSVSLILVKNFSPMSTTPVSDAFMAGVNNTAQEFLTSITGTGNACFAVVNDIGKACLASVNDTTKF
jgi:hypothetical protein